MKIALTFVLVSLLFACKRKDEYISVKGRIISSIDSTLPFSNTSFIFYTRISKGIGHAPVPFTQSFSTDSLGFVNTTINLKEFTNGFAVCWPSGDDNNYIKSITLEYNQKSVDFGTVYTKP